MEKYKKVTQENNGFKITAPTWNEEFKLPDGSYSILDIQDYYEYILKSMEKRQLIVQNKYTQEYIQIKQIIDSRLKLKPDIILNF